MSSCKCEICGAVLEDTPNGYVTFCQHHPPEKDADITAAQQIAGHERELAESAAVGTITCAGFLSPSEADSTDLADCYWQAPSDRDDREDFYKACDYLELRGLLERHPEYPGLVRPTQKGSLNCE